MDKLVHKNLHENLKHKIGNAAWLSATSVTKHLLDMGKLDLAKKHLEVIMENGKSDGKDMKPMVEGWLEDLKRVEENKEKLNAVIELQRWLKTKE
ncbi:MAG: hypothetical protein WC793_01345 [Candidatus Paceibacterota bacterium]|jgi:hypothetical protein